MVEVGDEEEEEGNDGIMETDPLSDPLAFDHDYAALKEDDDDPDLEEARLASPYRLSSRTSVTVDFEDDEEEDFTVQNGSTGEIIFVDINRLKANPVSPIIRTSTVPSTSRPPPATKTVPKVIPDPSQFPKLDTLDDRLPPEVAEKHPDPESSRSDGSDSGLGSELLTGLVNPPPSTISLEIDVEDQLDALIRSNASIASKKALVTSHHQIESLPVPVVSTLHQYDVSQAPEHHHHHPVITPPPPAPSRSALKRSSLELHEVGGDNNNSNNNIILAGESNNNKSKRARRTVSFQSVTVFYFSRIQGFLCVPSVGGCTLGMEARHMYEKSMTLNEHLAEQRRVHRQRLELLNPSFTRSQGQQLQQQLLSQSMSVPVHSGLSSDSDSDEEATSDISDVDTEQTGFLRPVGTKQRRTLLKAAGVRKIEASEKDECNVIRTSREVCGCRCQGYCDPELCYCSVNGIKCQVDRVNFPCSCTGECCGNRVGRVEFNPVRVRTHYIHTVMRLELEEKQQRLDRGKVDGVEEFDSSLNNSDRSRLGMINSNINNNNNNCREQFESSSSLRSNEISSQLARSEKDLNLLVPTVMQDELTTTTDTLINNRDHQMGYQVTLDQQEEHLTRDNNHNNTAIEKTNGTGSQFCNNILQILGIQTTPPTPTPPAHPLTTTTKDYSPRRLLEGHSNNISHRDLQFSSAGMSSYYTSAYNNSTTATSELLSSSRPFVVASSSSIEGGGVINKSPLMTEPIKLGNNGNGLVESNGVVSDWGGMTTNINSREGTEEGASSVVNKSEGTWK